jgi:hypothetical protein
MKLTERQLQVVKILESSTKPLSGWALARKMPPDYEKSNIYKVLRSLQNLKIAEQVPNGWSIREGWDKEEGKIGDLTLKFPQQLNSVNSIYKYENPTIHALATILHKTVGENFDNWQKHLLQNLDYDRVITDYIEMTLIFQIILNNKAFFPLQNVPERKPDSEELLEALQTKYFRSE